LRDDGKLSNEEVEVIKGNLHEIYAISKRNDMAHLIGYALENHGLISPEDEDFAKFQKQQYLAMYRCEGMEYEIARMRDALENEKIDFVLLKGAVIRELYPEGWMRTSSDIDILVHPEDLDRAEALLIGKLDYKKGIEGDHDRSFHSEGGVHVELHFTLIDDERANLARDVLVEAWEHATVADGKKHEHVFSEELFYFYHIAHLAKHVEYAGSGIRPFIDLWLINRNEAKNPVSRQEMLKRCSLDDFARLCDELADYWMGETDSLTDKGKRFELFILNCGLYGSEENRIAITRKNGQSTFGYVFSRIFMPYSSLKQIYPIIIKHKWLTPFCQMARWFKLVTGEKTRKAVKLWQ
ncbi:MAG: nucleotidyltransferase family protein, partial [Clostridia bacterium]|nr:nucleotidyltransferase family protein [Clostridia bacterium]